MLEITIQPQNQKEREIITDFLTLANIPFDTQANNVSTRGIRNNNPGNIRFNESNNWIGKISLDKKDDSFEEFSEMKYGVRALLKLMHNYLDKGANTIHEIIHRYAPAGDGSNNPDVYISFLVKVTGKMEHEVLLRDDMYMLLNGICKMESQYELTKKMFATAYKLV